MCLYEYSKCRFRFSCLNCEFINEIHVHNDTYGLDLIIFKNPMLSVYNNNNNNNNNNNKNNKLFDNDFSLFK